MFSLGREHTIPVLYFPSTALGKRSSELARTAEQITSLCVTLKEYPYVRYVSADPVTKELAQLVEKYLENVLRTLPNWNVRRSRFDVAVHLTHFLVQPEPRYFVLGRPRHRLRGARDARVHLPGNGERPARCQRLAIVLTVLPLA